MSPGPSLTELVETIRSDAESGEPLKQLATASQMAAAIAEVSDAALGFFVDQCRRGGHSWTEISTALGVTKQAAHKRFTGPEPSPGFFTPRAQAAVFAAIQEAAARGHNYVGTEHLLLGLFDPAGGIASQILAAREMTRESVGELLAAIVPSASGPTSTTDPPFTPRANQCVAQAGTEALLLGHNYVGTEHILLALAACTEGIAAQILAESGIGYDTAKAAVIHALPEFSSRATTA